MAAAAESTVDAGKRYSQTPERNLENNLCGDVKLHLQKLIASIAYAANGDEGATSKNLKIWLEYWLEYWLERKIQDD